jgi:hypothetical protein
MLLVAQVGVGLTRGRGAGKGLPVDFDSSIIDFDRDIIRFTMIPRFNLYRQPISTPISQGARPVGL